MGNVNAYLIWVILATFGALTLGTGVRMVALQNAATDLVRQRMSSLKVWWALAVIMSVSVVLGHLGATLLLGVASLLAMGEFLRLLGGREKIGNPAVASLAACGAIHYGLVAAGNFAAASWFLPIAALLLTGTARAPVRPPQDYIRTTAASFWGLMLMVYALSHALFFFGIDAQFNVDVNPPVGPAGWFLFIVILTEMNDIMQAIVGRQWGKTKITPLVSPNKSLEGLAGGLLTTVLLSIMLTPLLTTLTVNQGRLAGFVISIGAAIVISISGFLGDINMSAIKRDVGVKDGSSMLPGMGGIIDRVDSLIFSAPAFYYFSVFVKQWTG